MITIRNVHHGGCVSLEILEMNFIRATSTIDANAGAIGS
jgi:hypothetical protein